MNQMYLKDVREQYENFPYPSRNPKDESNRLLQTSLDRLSFINHYGFKGKIPLNEKDQGEEFRVLVAGGGTGDASTFLGFQLQGLNAKIIYLDISKESMNVAKERAEIRNLTNIEFIHGSILDLCKMDFEPFHYINCSGVLHHLSSPLDGLKALKSVLRDDGLIGIMVYGKYGRTGIYQMQDLMKLVNKNEENLQSKVDNTKEILKILPATNWYKRDEETFNTDVKKFGDIGIYDLFVHSQDRSYNVNELYQWVEEESALKIVDFIGNGLAGKVGYQPQTYISDEKILKKILKLNIIEQQAIAELVSGNMIKHTLYVSKTKNSIASIENLDLVPYFAVPIKCKDIAKMLEKNKALTFTKDGIKITILATKNLSKIFSNLDGSNSLREIFNSIKIENKILLEEFKLAYEKLFLLNLILLKDKNSSKLLTDITLNIERALSSTVEIEK